MKKLLFSISWMSYYQQPDSRLRDKVKLVLDMSYYPTKKELDHATGVDRYDLAVKKEFIALKVVHKLDINKLVNVPASLNNLKTKVHYLGSWFRIKNCSCRLEKIKWCNR